GGPASTCRALTSEAALPPKDHDSTVGRAGHSEPGNLRASTRASIGQLRRRVAGGNFTPWLSQNRTWQSPVIRLLWVGLEAGGRAASARIGLAGSGVHGPASRMLWRSAAGIA